MSIEEVLDPGVDIFRGFGHPRETPYSEVSGDPTMQRMLSDLNAEMEAKRLRAEAEMNTPVNRKKAAKVAEAELAEKRRAWGTRAWAMPLDGFKGIYDSAEDQELRVYTRTYDLKHKFWGIKPVGMTIWDFWDIHDPEVKRYDDANQETPTNPETLVIAPSPIEPTRRTKAVAKPRKQQKPSEINSTHRVRKSTESPKVNKNTRRSLADKVDAGQPGLGGLVREVAVTATAHASRRTTRKSTAGTSSSAQQEKATKEGFSAPSKLPRGRPAAKAGVAAKDDTSSHPKRPRGRPAAKGRPIETPPKQKKTPAAKGNARVTKSSQTEQRPSAPSTHKMRTRREGPAELLQLP